MIFICEKCGHSFDDVNVSRACPHYGLGYCQRCDRVICVCPQAMSSNSARVPWYRRLARVLKREIRVR